MNNFPTYIGGLVASWTVMNSKSPKAEPSEESVTILMCIICFWLGFWIGTLLLLIFF